MLIQDGPPESVKGVTFDTDTARNLVFKMHADPKKSSANIVYEITSPGVTFDDGTRQIQRSGVSVPTSGIRVTTPVAFEKTGSGPVFQIEITATVAEVGAGDAFAVDWVIPVVQTSLGNKLLGITSDASAAGDDGSPPDPLDRSELEHAARVLRTLQALVDHALNADNGGGS
jgi:hypothetical protein